MVISFWHSCVVLSCLVIPCLLAKPFNLNEAIAAEERQKALHTTTRPKFGTRLLTKPFNLNEVIAAEERQKAVHKTRPKFGIGLFAKPLNLNEDISAKESQTVIRSTTRPKTETSERFSLNKLLRTSPLKLRKSNLTEKLAERFSLSNLFNKTSPGRFNKVKETENKIPRGKKISPLQYRKTFQIKSPLKPKKLKTFEKARYRRRNQSIKREISEDEEITKKYLPLLKSISLLFDNILSETDDSFEIRIGDIGKYKHRKRNNTGCSCSGKSNNFTESAKEAAVSTTTFVPLTPDTKSDQPTQPITTEAPATTADSPTNSDVSDFRQNTDVPPVLPRNTPSPRRDHNGYSKRSRPSLHTSFEGNISGDYGDSERVSRSGEHHSHSKDYEEDPNSTAREHASSVEFRGRLRGDRPDVQRPVYRRGLDDDVTEGQADEYNLGKDRRNINEFQRHVDTKRKDGLRHLGGDINEPPGENQLEAGGDKTESATPVQQFVRGDRRFLSEESINSLQSTEDFEEGVVGVKHYIAGDPRLIVGDGQSTAEDQKTSPTNAALISIKDLNNPIIMLQNSRKHKAPFVTIIDGYSVARDKNGANKLAEQSIRFHS